MPNADFVGFGAGVVYCGLWVDSAKGAAPWTDPAPWRFVPAPCAEPAPVLWTVLMPCAAPLSAADVIRG